MDDTLPNISELKSYENYWDLEAQQNFNLIFLIYILDIDSNLITKLMIIIILYAFYSIDVVWLEIALFDPDIINMKHLL